MTTPNFTDEQHRQQMEQSKNILHEAPDEESIMEMCMDLQNTLETIHEYFARSIDHISSEDVNAIVEAGIEIRQAIP